MTVAIARTARISKRLVASVLFLLFLLWFLPVEQGMAQDISSSEAAAIVRKQTGGRVLSVRPQNRDQIRGYRVKVLLPKGRVRYFVVDGRTGRVVR